MRAFLFPGQGSQSVGMGAAIAEASPHAREVFAEVDDTLGQHLFALMTNGPEAELMLTANAQPAIMANAIAVLRVLEREAGLRLVDAAGFVAGHSLGEYSALCAAGAIDLPTATRLLRARGEAMQAAVPIGIGAMAVLLGSDVAQAQALCEASAQGEMCAIANDNDATQVVISGHATAIDRAVDLAKAHGIKRATRLAVSAPFHCPLMQPAADAMVAALADAVIVSPLVPVYANVTAAPSVDPAAIRAQLVAQVTGRVRWRESIANMARAGVDDFVELGAKVLAPMVKRTYGDARTASLTDMGSIEAMLKSL